MIVSIVYKLILVMIKEETIARTGHQLTMDKPLANFNYRYDIH